MSSDIEEILIQTCIKQNKGWIPDPAGHWFSAEAWAAFSQRAAGTLTKNRFWEDFECHPRMRAFYRYPKYGKEEKTA